MNDLVGGHVDFLCEQSVSVAEQIGAGTVKAYGVSANQRLTALPDPSSTLSKTNPFVFSCLCGRSFNPRAINPGSNRRGKETGGPPTRSVFAPQRPQGGLSAGVPGLPPRCLTAGVSAKLCPSVTLFLASATPTVGTSRLLLFRLHGRFND